MTINTDINPEFLSGLKNRQAVKSVLDGNFASIQSDLNAIGVTSPFVNVRDYGAKGDGVTDDLDAFRTAAASGKFVVVPYSADPYLISDYMDFASNTQLIGVNKPTIKLTSAPRAIRANAVSNVLIENIRFDGNKSVVSSGNFATVQNGCTNVVMRNCDVVDAKASYAITSGSSGCVVDTCSFTDGGTGNVDLIDSNFNEVKNCTMTGNVGFGILITGTASYNLVEQNTTTNSGLELIGLTYLCIGNRILGNHAENTGDNGISISGRRNIVSNNYCYNNAYNGISFFGDENLGVGNTCYNNGQAGGATQYSGIRIHGGFGWRGYNNTLIGNICGDTQGTATQKWGVRANGAEYTSWSAGATISASNPWRVNGVNVYRASNTGVTGATAPTHTSGTVSDGTINWEYVSSFVVNVSPRYNSVMGTRGQGNLTGLEDVLPTNLWLSQSRLALSSEAAADITQSLYAGSGSPEGAVTATAGALYLRSDPSGMGLCVYQKSTGSGNSGWMALQPRGNGTTASRPTPVSGERGVQWYDSTTGRFTVWNGTAWEGALGTLPTYADDAAAGAGGLTEGRYYKSSDGIVRIKL